MTLLVTGAAGFIGFHVCKRYLDMGQKVVVNGCIKARKYGAAYY